MTRTPIKSYADYLQDVVVKLKRENKQYREALHEIEKISSSMIKTQENESKLIK